MISSLIIAVVLSAVSVKLAGPTEATVGDLVTIDASGSVGDGWKWILPEGVAALTSDRQLVLHASQPGEITIIGISADLSAAIAVGTHTVKVTGKPAPTVAGGLPHIVMKVRDDCPECVRWRNEVEGPLLKQGWRIQLQHDPTGPVPAFVFDINGYREEIKGFVDLAGVEAVLARAKEIK